jgi:hypothetical protein
VVVNVSAERRLLHPPAALYALWSVTTQEHCCDVLELEGTLDPSLLRATVELVVRRHPLLSFQLTRRWNRFEWQPLSGPVPIHFASCEEPELHTSLMRNAWGPRSPEDRTRAVAFHVTQCGSRSFLQVVSPHFATDATSGARIAYDLTQIYSTLEAGNPVSDFVFDAVDRSPEALFHKPSTPGDRLHRWRDAALETWRDARSDGCGLALPATLPRGKMSLLRVDLDSRLLSALKSESKRRRTTLHALLCLGTLRAREHFNRSRGRPNEPALLTDLVSLRPFVRRPELAELAEVMSLPFTHRLDPTRSEDELLDDIVRDIQRAKSGGVWAELSRMKLLARAPVPHSAMNAVQAKVGHAANLTVTNPGPVPYPLENMGTLPVRDFYSFAPCFPPGRLMLSFTTFRNRMRLVATYDANAFSGGLSSEFVGPLEDELRRLGGVPNATRACPAGHPRFFANRHSFEERVQLASRYGGQLRWALRLRHAGKRAPVHRPPGGTRLFGTQSLPSNELDGRRPSLRSRRRPGPSRSLQSIRTCRENEVVRLRPDRAHGENVRPRRILPTVAGTRARIGNGQFHAPRGAQGPAPPTASSGCTYGSVHRRAASRRLDACRDHGAPASQRRMAADEIRRRDALHPDADGISEPGVQKALRRPKRHRPS